MAVNSAGTQYGAPPGRGGRAHCRRGVQGLCPCACVCARLQRWVLMHPPTRAPPYEQPGCAHPALLQRARVEVPITFPRLALVDALELHTPRPKGAWAGPEAWSTHHPLPILPLPLPGRPPPSDPLPSRPAAPPPLPRTQPRDPVGSFTSCQPPQPLHTRAVHAAMHQRLPAPAPRTACSC